MHWWTEHEAREKRTDRTALPKPLCAWDPSWLWTADHSFGGRGKTSTRQRPRPKKNRRSFAGTLDTTLIGFLYQPSRFFAPGLRRTFIWKNGHALMYLRPGSA